MFWLKIFNGQHLSAVKKKNHGCALDGIVDEKQNALAAVSATISTLLPKSLYTESLIAACNYRD